jgi:hypothetical protein
MKTLNFLFVMAICLMAISHVSATYYIIKTFENYSSKSTKGKEGDLKEKGLKRVECFAGLIGSKVNKPDAIFYKADGTDKTGAIKTVNSRRNTAQALQEKIGVEAQEISGDDAQLANIKTTLLDANKINNAIFVWSDKEKATKLATALGATNAPAEFAKENYGYIWAIDGTSLKEVTMDCEGLENTETKNEDGKDTQSSGAVSVRYSVMTVAAAIIASLYLLF